MNSKNVVLTPADWNVAENRYMAPKVNDKGAKSIMLISKQTNKMLHVATPLMMTWGIADFVDETGKSDGKFSISLNFPSEDYQTDATTELLSKFKAFEEQVLNDAVANSEIWWGEKMSKEVCKHTFFPFLKYPKNKDTKKTDYTKPPSIRAKVPYYNGKWETELYDIHSNRVFPDEEHPDRTPIELVPKQSRIAAIIKCTGIWIGGKGWGLTWKLFQGVVKPNEVASMTGRNFMPQGMIAAEEAQAPAQVQAVAPAPAAVETVFKAPAPAAPVKAAAPVPSTVVDDSDEEEEPAALAEQAAAVEEPAPEPEAEPEPEPVAAVEEAPKKVVKKVVVKRKV